MKVFYVILFSLAVSIKSFSQEPDFLSKYSYLCLGFTGTKAHSGTCFFYKEKSKIYVVSNYHVFYDMDPFNGVIVSHIDSFKIIIPDTNSHRNNLITLFNGNDTVETFRHYDRLDLMAKRVNIDKKIKINFINEFLDKKYVDSIPIRVYTFGYPLSLIMGFNVNNGNTFKIEKKVELYYHEGFTQFPNSYVTPAPKSYFGISLNTEPTDQILEKMNKTEIEFGGYCEKGSSGSPIFGQFIKNKKIVYKLIGVIFGSNQSLNTTIAIKLSSIFYYLVD